MNFTSVVLFLESGRSLSKELRRLGNITCRINDLNIRCANAKQMLESFFYLLSFFWTWVAIRSNLEKRNEQKFQYWSKKLNKYVPVVTLNLIRSQTALNLFFKIVRHEQKIFFWWQRVDILFSILFAILCSLYYDK